MITSLSISPLPCTLSGPVALTLSRYLASFLVLSATDPTHFQHVVFFKNKNDG
jgi:hypothetical protein